MEIAPIPANEEERLAALRKYDILDTEAEKAFDDIARVASHICGVPISLITLIDEDRQWFKSAVGMGDEISETPREHSFCAHAILESETLVVENAAQDERFADNPYVADDPSIRFYAGAQLKTTEGQALGTLCVLDQEPRELTEDQRKALEALSRQVVSLMELRRNMGDLRIAHEELHETHEQLRIAKEEAERANQAKTDFVAMVSHEMKNPLTSIRGYLEIMLADMDASLEEGSRNFLERINTNVGRMLTLISDLSNITQIEGGHIELNIRPIAITGAIGEVVQSHNQAIKRKNQNLVLDIHGDLPNVSADYGRMVQILSNLVSNAYKYTPKDGTITITAEHKRQHDQEDGLPVIHIAVADTGLGIPDEDQDQIFQQFFRAGDPTVQKDIKGTGLGLNITKRLVELHNGRIWFESEYRKGTTFHIELPLAPTEQPDTGVHTNDPENITQLEPFPGD